MEISVMSENKLSDAQLVLLSATAQQTQGAIKLELKGAAATKVVGKLLREKLVEEVPSGGMLPEWRRDAGLGSLALCITKRGLATIGVEASNSEQGGEPAREDLLPGRSLRYSESAPFDLEMRNGSRGSEITRGASVMQTSVLILYQQIWFRRPSAHHLFAPDIPLHSWSCSVCIPH
jgi:hypothetical protein